MPCVISVGSCIVSIVVLHAVKAHFHQGNGILPNRHSLKAFLSFQFAQRHG